MPEAWQVLGDSHRQFLHSAFTEHLLLHLLSLGSHALPLAQLHSAWPAPQV